ncbi:MAG: FAD-dependent oxidoreductase [Dysgonomonas sp.]|nr:FAD-dependent oxidoreductase [Dysgonomonas sp.]
MNKYDIIIAGSGLGGLECGALLSKEGYNVCVLEKNPLFGGCLQTFARKKYMLDTGIHYIGSLDDGQIMNQYFKYFGILDKLNMRKMDKDCFDKIIYQAKEYEYAMGHDSFTESLSQHFPKERDNLKEYIRQLQQVGNLISVEKLKKGIIAQNGMEFFYASASGRIAEITKDETLRNVLAATSMLYGGVKESSTFYHHAMVNNSYIESAYRFVDGTIQIADALVDVIRQNGGTVLKNKEVTRFIVKDDKVEAVEVNGEEIIEAKNFISNIHPKKSLQLLDKNRSIKNAYISRINALPNSFGVFTLYLLMKKDKERYMNRNYYIHNTDNVWYNSDTSKNKVNNVLICYQAGKSEKYSEVITLLSPLYMSELKEWEHTTPGKRGEGYLAFKEEFAGKMLDLLKERGYDYSENIEDTFTTTPLSYRDYIGTTDGAAYGIIKDYKFPEIGFILPKTKLKNFYFTGQNMNVHGALGVTLTTMYTCAEFLGQEYIAKKVGNA